MLNIFLGGRHPQVRTHPSTAAVLLLLLAANQIRLLPWLAGRRSQKTVANIDSLVLEVGGSCAPSPTFFKPSRGSGSNLVAWKKNPKKNTQKTMSPMPLGPLWFGPSCILCWCREFQRMGGVLEKSWRQAWGDRKRELEARCLGRSGLDDLGDISKYQITNIVVLEVDFQKSRYLHINSMAYISRYTDIPIFDFH